MSNENIHSSQIGLRIRTARKKKGLNQTEFANLLGKSLRTVQKYENGEIDISIAMLNEIAKVLDCEISYLIGCDSQRKPLSNLSDVVNFFCMLDKIDNVHFGIETKRPPQHDGWECTIKFTVDDALDLLNRDICYFLEDFERLRQEVRTYQTSEDDFKKWQEQSAAIYSKRKLKERTNKILSTEERLLKYRALINERFDKKES